MIIDCMSCVARPTACGDCVITVVLGAHPDGVALDAEERTAVAVLAGSGLVPPLRLMPPAATSSEQPAATDGGGAGMRQRWSRRQRAG